METTLSDKETLVSKYIGAGYRIIPLKGKVPIISDWPKVKYSDTLSPEIKKHIEQNNYGVALQEDDLVIDVDVHTPKEGQSGIKDFKNGVKSFQQLMADFDLGEIQKTCIVRTGNKGFHIYLKKPKDTPIKLKVSEYPGLEFKSFGGQVVGPGCTHPDTQLPYFIKSGDISSVIKAPAPLLELVKAEKPKAKEPGLSEAADSTQSTNRFIQFLKKAKTATEGDAGDIQTFKIACRGRDFGLSEEKTLEYMLSNWNERCEPPWGTDELETKVRNAYRYNEEELGKWHPSASFEEVSKEEQDPKTIPPLTTKWELNANGTLKKTLINVIHAFSEDKKLRNILRYNEFTRGVEFAFAAPWHKKGTFVEHLRDNDVINAKFYLAITFQFEVTVSLIYEAFAVMAHANTYHPVRDYLDSLKWDKTPRLDTWLIDYAGTKDTGYVRAIARKTLTAAVARIYEPGCKFDSMLVLEGKQNMGKSFLISTLAGKWFTDRAINVHDKDTVDAMLGKWFVEMAEMECNTRTETQALKAFISRQVDRMRPAYARVTEDFPRQNIFIGSVNPESVGYLKDTTGNRRFWPVFCTQIHTKKLQEDRDQLWAEATMRYRAGEKLYLDDVKMQEEALAEAEERRTEDPWTETISDWLDTTDETGEARDVISGKEIWEECFGGASKGFGRQEQIRIANVLKIELKWEKGFFYCPSKNKTVSGYRRPKTEENA